MQRCNRLNVIAGVRHSTRVGLGVRPHPAPPLVIHLILYIMRVSLKRAKDLYLQFRYEVTIIRVFQDHAVAVLSNPAKRGAPGKLILSQMGNIDAINRLFYGGIAS